MINHMVSMSGKHGGESDDKPWTPPPEPPSPDGARPK